MVDSNNQSLTSLLASSPATLTTVLSFPANVVNFATDVVEPVFDYSQANVNQSLQAIRNFFVNIDGNGCKVTMKPALKPVSASVVIQ
jgi:hypothetical protein